MALLRGLIGLLKIIALIILVLAIAIPLRYGSTNHKHIIIRLIHSGLSLKYSFIPDAARPTLSADYRAMEELLRRKPLFELNASEDPLVTVKRIRQGSSMRDSIITPSTCRINKEVFEHDGHTVDTYWIENHQKTSQRHADHIMIYIHGGGYIFGDIDSK